MTTKNERLRIESNITALMQEETNADNFELLVEARRLIMLMKDSDDDDKEAQ